MRILLLHDTQHDLPAIESVLAAQGFRVRSVAVNAMTLQREIEQWNPNLVLIAADDPSRDMMEQICVVSQFREHPIIVFTEDDDQEVMRRAMSARVSAYVVAGLNPKRVRSVIDVALERFRLDQLQFTQLVEVQQVVENQRQMNRAKSLLLRRGMSEPEAYAHLRRYAMSERCTIAEAAARFLRADVADLI